MATPDVVMPGRPIPRVLTPDEWEAYRPPLHLSEREWEVMRGVGHALANKEIAGAMGISVQTVKNHVSNVIAKLGAVNRIDALLKLGWLQVPER